MKILTANRLLDGEAVWLAPDHSWAENIQDAQIAEEPLLESKLEMAGKAALAKNEVVDVNLIDVRLVEGRIYPTRLREQIRAAGPSTHIRFGKQARFGGVDSRALS